MLSSAPPCGCDPNAQSPVPDLPLLQDLQRVQAAGLLDGRDAVGLGVVRHHGAGLGRAGPRASVGRPLKL